MKTSKGLGVQSNTMWAIDMACSNMLIGQKEFTLRIQTSAKETASKKLRSAVPGIVALPLNYRGICMREEDIAYPGNREISGLTITSEKVVVRPSQFPEHITRVVFLAASESAFDSGPTFSYLKSIDVLVQLPGIGQETSVGFCSEERIGRTKIIKVAELYLTSKGWGLAIYPESEPGTFASLCKKCRINMVKANDSTAKAPKFFWY